MEANTQEKTGFKLFREKSLDAVESPEKLNDYLRVTSPGVWLVLVAIIAILIGFIFWAVLGRINTSQEIAVSVRDGHAVCVVPYEAMESAMKAGEITVNGQQYSMILSGDDIKTEIVSDATSASLRVTGGLAIGDLVVEIPVEVSLADGVYKGTILTESLQPISLLLQ